MREMEKVCCLCGKRLTDEGNEPWPLKDEGRCCDTCNEDVIEARIVLFTQENPD